MTNPLIWTTKTDFAPKESNYGTVLPKSGQVVPELIHTQGNDGLLWVTKPKFPGSFLINTLHHQVAGYNFFYVKARQNAIDRVEAFLNHSC